MDPVCEINLNNILYNFDAVKRAAKNKKICAMIKADAYGHGLIETAGRLSGKADYFGLARGSEAVKLRKAGITDPALIVGPLDDGETLTELIKSNVTLTVMSEDDVERVITAAVNAGKKAKVHIKVNTGMNRLGVQSAQEAEAVAVKISKSKRLELEGAFTHFADAEGSPEYLTKQYGRFLDMIKQIDVPLKHCAASAAALDARYKDLEFFDMVRPGIALYGYGADWLKQAMRVTAYVAKIYAYPARSPIGYLRAYYTERDCLLAVVRIGYGDGLFRLKSAGGMVIGGAFCKIVGNVCMDLTTVDVTDAPNAREGAEAELISENQPAGVLAGFYGGIAYNALTCWKDRVTRRFISRVNAPLM